MARTENPVQPLRLKVKAAAVLLNLSVQGVRDLVRTGVLSATRPHPAGEGAGRGKRLYLDPGEVKAYATGGIGGAMTYRKRHAKRK